MKKNIHTGNLFLATALFMLFSALLLGLLSSIIYLFPGFLKDEIGFSALRPLHVSAALFWIILGATGCLYNGLRSCAKQTEHRGIGLLQWGLWVFAIAGIFYSYFTKNFGGREYWEFNAKWALPIGLAWVLFLVNFVALAKKIRQWPVYMWMWMTGIIFFLFTFSENYLWIFPYFRESLITDMTIQWKVNGSLVGSWNQILYGTAFFLMDRLSNSGNTGKNKFAFFMYFLGLFNLMFNWGHHIYSLPTESYIRYIGYVVSMTEWVFFVLIIRDWKKSITTFQKNYHYYPYRFIMAADVWVFINMGQAILMSIPVLNLYTHGTHVTVAHAMGTTIGINSMIILAACFEFLKSKETVVIRSPRWLNFIFWMLQVSLLLFWLSLNAAGIKKGIWQLNPQQGSYSQMMDSLAPFFTVFVIAGLGLLIALSALIMSLLHRVFRNKALIVYENEDQSSYEKAV